MGRRIGLFALLLGAAVTLVAAAGLLEGSFASASDWRVFAGAVAGVILGVSMMGWGGTRYVGVGARI